MIAKATRPRDAKGRFLPATAKQGKNGRRPVQVSVRAYSGGMDSRLTDDWTGAGGSANEELESRFRLVRKRARDLEQNNSHARRFLQMAQVNIFGPHGIRVQSDARDADGTPDRGARNLIEDGWRRWGKVGTCTLDGRLAWPEVEAMAMRRVLVDGEALLEKIPAADNLYGFAVRLLDADLLDETHSEDLRGGRRVRCGVEIDEATERPIAYHMLTEAESKYGRKRKRVPAERIIHLYFQERPHQYRGITWLASSMVRSRMLDSFEHSATVAARVAAGKMGFFKPDAETYTGEGKDPDGFTLTTAEPGEFEELPLGMSFEKFDPEWPPNDFKAFSQEIKRGIASGLGVSYVGLANDLEGVSYSSIRQGELADRDWWRTLQQWSIRHLSEPVFIEWLLMGLTMGAVGNLPLAKRDKFERVRWQPRGWDWVDPLKEIQAVTAAVALGVQSRTDIAADKGRDLEDVLRQLAQEDALADELGVDIHPDVAPANVPEDPPVAQNV